MIDEVRRFSKLEQLLQARRDSRDHTLFLAGGTEINRLGGTGVKEQAICLSLEGLGLDRIEKMADGVHIGAVVNLQQLIDSSDVPTYLKVAANFAGSRTLRNMATVGGNIGAYREDSYLVPTLIAAKARIITAEMNEDGGIEQENVPIREFIENFEEFKNCCITGIILNKKGRCVMSKRFSRTKQRKPDVTVAFGCNCSGGVFSDVRTAAAASGIGITRLTEVDKGIEDGSLNGENDFLELVKRVFHPSDDITGSTEYKQYLVAVTLADMTASCRERKNKGDC
jgi:putative selenate reductase FAD-binding subunit